jgi:hypothetical protein
MFGSGILDVILGLIFFYFLLSTLCATVQEWIAAVLQLRAKTLQKALRNLLGGEAAQVEAHPLIQGLGLGGGRLPSYIPARNFSAALIDTLAGTRGEGQTDADVLCSVRQAVLALPDSHARRSLLVLLDNAGGDLGRARAAIERWFDDAMDRVSGWYRRGAQRNIVIIALLFVGALNGDTLVLAKGLWRDGLLRESVTTSARELREKGQQAPNVVEIQQRLGQLHAPLGWRLADLPGQKALESGGLWTAKDVLWWWAAKVLGLMMTLIAVSLGAPFWFQLLNKVSTLRASGERPERAAAEATVTAAAAATVTTTAPPSP